MQDEDVVVPDDQAMLAVDPHTGWIAAPWFELALEESGWAVLYLGLDNGSRLCCQTLRLALSQVWDPLPDFAQLAEHAWTGSLPFSFSVDSEGPETRVSLLPGPADGLAILDIRDEVAAAVYLVAVVEARALGVALAHALQVAIRNPAMAERWAQWEHLTGASSHADYFGSPWLRDLVIDSHVLPASFSDGNDTTNADHYPWTPWKR